MAFLILWQRFTCMAHNSWARVRHQLFPDFCSKNVPDQVLNRAFVVQTSTLVSQTNTISFGPEFYTCVFQGHYDLFSEVYTPFQMA